jgi:hypothetical protein
MPTQTISMKKVLFTCTAILVFITVYAQNDSGNSFFTSTGKQYLFYIDKQEDSATVFRLGYMLDKAGSGYYINFTDSMTRQAGGDGYNYTGKKTRLENEKDKLYLVFQDVFKHQAKRVELKTIAADKKIYTTINNGYWWRSFISLTEDLNTKFAWNHYSFRNGFPLWDSFVNKESHYKDFILFTDEKIRKLRDSITAAETVRTGITHNIIDNISTIPYEALKESLSKLPYVYDGSAYFRTVIEAVCINRPEVFFRLAEELPDLKTPMFSVAGFNRKAVKKLKATETTSPLKKEFFKRKK